MDDFVAQLPKAELHLHLEGSVEPETLYELDPSTPLDELRALYQYSDFDAFLRAFGAVGKRLRRPADYGLITRRLLERLEAQNVRYAEIIVAAGVVLWKEQEFGPIFDEIAAAAEESPIQTHWIFDAVRQFGTEQARMVAEWAAERQDRGVVAFGIGGSEARGPAELFGEIFSFAKREGLHLVAHAGEGTSAQSIRAALAIGAERIGHGISAVEDSDLMRELRELDVPLEICVSSNLVTGVVKSVEEHPLRRLFDAGVPIVLNTDDPAMFRCTLNGEYELAMRQFGFTAAEMRGVAENGFRYAFEGSISSDERE